jgi:hypothetical protein
MRKTFLHFLLLVVVTLSSSNLLFAQKGISGKIVGVSNNQAVSGASVLVKGKNIGASTSVDGNFSIDAKQGDILVITGIGVKAKEHEVTTGFQLISVDVETADLNEVVVTALGIRKDKRKLGYALQEVKGDALTVARETNVVNQLAGKVAGVTVVGSNSGVGGSARVTIRGERSVDLNKNQPLYVIDGVPISNSIVGANGRGNMEVDFGNGAGIDNVWVGILNRGNLGTDADLGSKKVLLCGGESVLPDLPSGAQPDEEVTPQELMKTTSANVEEFRPTLKVSVVPV